MALRPGHREVRIGFSHEWHSICDRSCVAVDVDLLVEGATQPLTTEP
ncbi:hypothetical protein SAMN06265222_1275 [Neorhodopirellula lusitana]|uniref:Uncharacterized protein n=1 Tax=Neorhodopirellula lusitana TaxID=445327 RepID=A0ABY1QRU5_9BACT|nr:hypothetical protein SAMN06265222_1275 [Neorhodopirellula lusitana]